MELLVGSLWRLLAVASSPVARQLALSCWSEFLDRVDGPSQMEFVACSAGLMAAGKNDNEAPFFFFKSLSPFFFSSFLSLFSLVFLFLQHQQHFSSLLRLLLSTGADGGPAAVLRAVGPGAAPPGAARAAEHRAGTQPQPVLCCEREAGNEADKICHVVREGIMLSRVL